VQGSGVLPHHHISYPTLPSPTLGEEVALYGCGYTTYVFLQVCCGRSLFLCRGAHPPYPCPFLHRGGGTPTPSLISPYVGGEADSEMCLYIKMSWVFEVFPPPLCRGGGTPTLPYPRGGGDTVRLWLYHTCVFAGVWWLVSPPPRKGEILFRVVLQLVLP
jgi:hypothetical protein